MGMYSPSKKAESMTSRAKKALIDVATIHIKTVTILSRVTLTGSRPVNGLVGSIRRFRRDNCEVLAKGPGAEEIDDSAQWENYRIVKGHAARADAT